MKRRTNQYDSLFAVLTVAFFLAASSQVWALHCWCEARCVNDGGVGFPRQLGCAASLTECDTVTTNLCANHGGRADFQCGPDDRCPKPTQPRSMSCSGTCDDLSAFEGSASDVLECWDFAVAACDPADVDDLQLVALTACCLPDNSCREDLTDSECTDAEGKLLSVNCPTIIDEKGGCDANVPATSEWGLAVLALVVLIAGTVALRRREAALT
jgi:hypothetical protein